MIRLLHTTIISVFLGLSPLGGNVFAVNSPDQNTEVETGPSEEYVFRTINKNVRFSWEPNKRLSWSDFRGVPDRYSNFAATSNTGISHTYTLDAKGYYIKNSSQVRANFYPNLSWYIPKLINETTLAHEQTHFDISELHARILRKAIAEYRFSRNSKSEIQSIYQQVEKARKAMQADFDRETKHSVDRQKEIAWEAHVAQLLYKYRFWAN
ncbi:DUF922 domain-containing protein [Leeuwenhoekiella parthenopeia]|uniref:DUF922 domain-containing protein n=1 Tax=Leeuwenhoekiella parthenopeia TaxID=2890320 RepID=A0ABS8GUX4_9FLAO|nr:DUF922 domain-containing protein [Leeuwenhoekiella parthenopeia]MCC4213815.1 DUF922 domain-containing protein [Leeuwenhoekiella parthenopeia]